MAQVRQRHVFLHRRLIDVRVRRPSLILRETVAPSLLLRLREVTGDDPDVARYITAYRTSNGRAMYEQSSYETFAPQAYLGSVYIGRMFTRQIGGTTTFQAQRLNKVHRNSLFRHTHTEVDIHNSMPTIISLLFGHLPLEALPEYVESRDDLAVQLGQPVTPVILKDVVLKVLNGMREPWGYPMEIVHALRSKPFLRRLEGDVKTIVADMKEKYSQFYHLVKSKKGGRSGSSVDASALSILYQDIENEVLMTMVESIQESHPDCIDLVLMFDGLLVPTEIASAPGFLGYLMERVREKVGVEVSLCTKSMEPYHDLVVPDPNEEEELQNAGATYEEWKRKFEETHYYLREPMLFAEVWHSGTRHCKLDMFRNTVCMEEPSEFVKEWLADRNKRAYLREEFCPPPLECPEDTFNTFSGLAADKLPAVAEDAIEDLIGPLLKQCCILTNAQTVEEDSCAYLLNWLALRVQKPGIRPLVALGFRSKEGVGKDSFFEWFGTKLLGPDYFINFPELGVMFSPPMRAAVQDKLLVTVSEVSRSDHKTTVHKLKGFLTDKHLVIRKLYCEPFTRLNMCAVVMFSQDDQFIDLNSVGDRRYQLFNSSPLHANDADYFGPLFQCYERGDCARAFYQFLMGRDIENWNASRDRVQTQIQTNMARFSGNPLICFLLKFLPMESHRNTRRDQTHLIIFLSELRQEFAKFVEERYPQSFQEMAKLGRFKAMIATLEMDSAYKSENGEELRAVTKIRRDGCNAIKVHYDRIMAILRALVPEDGTFQDDD